MPKSKATTAPLLRALRAESSYIQNSRYSMRDRSAPVEDSSVVRVRQRGPGVCGRNQRGRSTAGSGSHRPPTVSGWRVSHRMDSTDSPAPSSRICGSISRARNWTCAPPLTQKFCHTRRAASASSNPVDAMPPTPRPRVDDGRLPTSHRSSLSGTNAPPSSSNVSTYATPS
ncbi:MAG: hypothetical protein A2085_07565 [Gemmatimonadetes bacterium GWC2_71_10]|nr:MAG: hypothetical protein A2085_07565 [Gemmatimonadetes bacterium GWC2_71_10]